MRLKRILLFFLLLSIGALKAQQYSFIHHGVEEGLSQSVVNTIVQDKDGYLWIGTMSGLNRFDGKSFKLFDQKDSLAENWISASFEDSKGNLWFGHWAGGLSVFNWERQAISNYNFAQYSDFKSITSFAEDSAGNIYIGTDGNGLMYLNTSTNEVFTFNKEGRLSSNYILDLAFDDQQRLWIATDRGITIKNNNEENTFQLLDRSSGLVSSLVNCLTFLGEGKMAVGYYNNGISIVDFSGDKFSFQEEEIYADSSGGTEVQSMLADSRGNLWIGTAKRGIYKYTLESGKLKQFDTEEGLNYFSVKSIIEDREDNIWIGTDLGLNLFTGEVFRLYNEDHGLSNNIVWSIDNSNQGGLWIGTNAGMDFYNKNKFRRIPGTEDLIIITIFEDSRGLVWAGTPGEGLLRYDPKAEKLSILQSDSILPDLTVYSITEDDEGYLWIGTKKGAVRYHPIKKERRLFTTKDGLGGNNIYRIYIDQQKQIWFASLGGKLSKYQDGKFKTFGEEEGIDQRFIITVSEDNNGHLWFGAYGGTIFEYDGKEFTAHAHGDENSLNTPYAIIADQNNQLWIGNSQGLTLYEVAKSNFKDFGRREGFMGVEANSNASVLDPAGNIWIGTIMGLVQFSPNLVTANDQEPLTQIYAMELKHERTELLDSAVYEYKDNNFTFLFKGISLKNPEDVRYRYRLSGLEKEYSPASKVNRASYSNLMPGNYTLEVIASNKDGIWNQEPAQYSFSIKPPFYLTTWFYMLVGVTVILLFWLIMRIRTASLKRAKVRLEAVVQERTLELRDRNDELAQKNKDITDSIRYAKRIQTAILPEDEVFKGHLPNSFVYFRPKDIVSGDFYWIDKIGEKVIVSAIDCTGHGVPGAFMSLVGYNGLNKIISEKKVTDAGEILSKLDRNVAKALKQSDKDGIKDGMDMSICVIDTLRKTVNFAGANNPVYIVKESRDEILEIKGTKQAIGSFTGKEVDYESHQIAFESGDQFYLFSDGFADQFGGEQGKKFKSKAFKELLLSIREEDMEVQKEKIGMSIMKWKGELEQVDDIVVLGFRL